MKQSVLSLQPLDCFAEPVLGQCGALIQVLAMTNGLRRRQVSASNSASSFRRTRTSRSAHSR